MLFSPALISSLVAFFATSTTAAPAAPAFSSVSDQVDFYQASGLAEFKDGSYVLEYDISGNPKITFAPLETSQLAGRELNTTAEMTIQAEGCDGFQLNPRDTDVANGILQDRCGSGRYGTTWEKVGDTVAFYCQYAEGPRCRASESQNANHWITQKCGRYGAGSYESAKREYAYGYTNPARHSFCNIIL